jgi:hypothetical protein
MEAVGCERAMVQVAQQPLAQPLWSAAAQDGRFPAIARHMREKEEDLLSCIFSPTGSRGRTVYDVGSSACPYRFDLCISPSTSQAAEATIWVRSKTSWQVHRQANLSCRRLATSKAADHKWTDLLGKWGMLGHGDPGDIPEVLQAEARAFFRGRADPVAAVPAAASQPGGREQVVAIGYAPGVAPPTAPLDIAVPAWHHHRGGPV